MKDTLDLLNAHHAAHHAETTEASSEASQYHTPPSTVEPTAETNESDVDDKSTLGSVTSRGRTNSRTDKDPVSLLP